MDNLIQEFSDYLIVIEGRSENTASAYQRNILQFINLTDISDPRSITQESVLRFLRQIADSTEPITRNQKLASLKKFCEFLKFKGIVENNTLKNIPIASIERKIPEYMTTNEAIQMIETVNSNTAMGAKKRAIFELLFGCGIRVSELVNIRIENIDFDNEYPKLNVLGKGNKHRLVPVGNEAIKSILHWLKVRDIDSDYLFPSKNSNQPVTPRSIQQMVKTHAKRYGINNGNVTPHTFRHTYATTLYSNNMQISSIQKALGHSDIATTMIYTHISIDDIDREFRSCHPRS